MSRSAFARSGHTSFIGKVQPPLGQLRLHQLADERIRDVAARAKKPVLELARDILEMALVGRKEIDHHNTIYLDQIEALLPKRNEKVPSE